MGSLGPDPGGGLGLADQGQGGPGAVGCMQSACGFGKSVDFECQTRTLASLGVVRGNIFLLQRAFVRGWV